LNKGASRCAQISEDVPNLVVQLHGWTVFTSWLESSILVKLAAILHTKPFICVAVYTHMHCNPSQGCGGLHSTVHYKGWSHCCEGVPYPVILLPD